MGCGIRRPSPFIAALRRRRRARAHGVQRAGGAGRRTTSRHRTSACSCSSCRGPRSPRSAKRRSGPRGFAWVLTSPPQEHIDRDEWWASYQPVSYELETRLGTRDEFADMVRAVR